MPLEAIVSDPQLPVAVIGSGPPGPPRAPPPPVAVIGPGPVGLAAAAHLVERGLDPLVLEAAGEVAGGVASWGHVRLFSPWRYSVDAAAPRLLERDGWIEPDGDDRATGAELRERYLLPLSRVPELNDRIRTGH